MKSFRPLKRKHVSKSKERTRNTVVAFSTLLSLSRAPRFLLPSLLLRRDLRRPREISRSSQGLKIPWLGSRRVPSYRSETRLQERKCKSDVGGLGESDGVLRAFSRFAAGRKAGGRRGVVRGGERGGVDRLHGCVCARVFGGERSVDANATLVGGWLFRRPVIYRPSCARNSLFSNPCLVFVPPTWNEARTHVFSSPRGRRSSLFLSLSLSAFSTTRPFLFSFSSFFFLLLAFSPPFSLSLFFYIYIPGSRESRL